VPSRFQRHALKISLSLIAAALTIGLLCEAEWIARCYGPGRQRQPLTADYLTYLRESTKPLFKIKTIGGRPSLVQNDTIWKLEKRQIMPLDKPPDVRRILIAGESSADDLGDALRQEIKVGPSPGNYQVLNCAIGGADLDLVERRFDECMKYSPDAVIFLFGHNLYYSHPDASPLLLRLILWTRKSALISYLNVFDPKQDYEDAKRWRALESFIDTMAEETQSRGLPLILATVPSNLWVEPQPNAGDDFAPVYLEARYEYDSGHRKEAITLLTLALDTHPSALWHFTLGTWFYREGTWQKAYAQLILARDVDPARLRASTAVNSLIRRAAVRDGAMLVDAEQIIENQAPHGIPGWKNFHDTQHVKYRNFQELAHFCALQLMDRGWSGLTPKTYRSAPLSPPLRYSEIANVFHMLPQPAPSGWRSFSYFAERHLPQLRAQADSIFVRAFPDPKKRSAAFLGLAEALWRTGRHGEARAANKKARLIFPGWADPHIQSGFFDIQENRRADALKDFRQALTANPGDPRAVFFMRRLAGIPYSALRAGAPRAKLSRHPR